MGDFGAILDLFSAFFVNQCPPCNQNFISEMKLFFFIYCPLFIIKFCVKRHNAAQNWLQHLAPKLNNKNTVQR